MTRDIKNWNGNKFNEFVDTIISSCIETATFIGNKETQHKLMRIQPKFAIESVDLFDLSSIYFENQNNPEKKEKFDRFVVSYVSNFVVILQVIQEGSQNLLETDFPTEEIKDLIEKRDKIPHESLDSNFSKVSRLVVEIQKICESKDTLNADSFIKLVDFFLKFSNHCLLDLKDVWTQKKIIVANSIVPHEIESLLILSEKSSQSPEHSPRFLSCKRAFLKIILRIYDILKSISK